VTDRILTVDNLSVRRGRRTVLSGVTFGLTRGETVAVLGPNGAGKTTLLDAVAGIAPIAAGTITTAGRVATARQSADLARRSASKNVELALAWWGVPRHERARRAQAALDAVGAQTLGSRSSVALSGGERRRVHLARAIATRPDLLLLDEPFAGLDHEVRAGLMADTASALRGSAGSVIVVVHDRAEAWALADRLLVLLDGTVAADGPPRQLLDNPPTPQVARFLGYTGELRFPDVVLFTRPAQVVLDPAGEFVGSVRRCTPLEDGTRIEVDLPAGFLTTVTPVEAPPVGADVRMRVTGGVRFAASAVAAGSDRA